MKKIILIVVAVLSFLSKDAFAQPANNNCATAQNIGTLPSPAACSGTAPQLGATLNIPGTLVGATPASPYIYQPGCTGGAMSVPANDVWYSFTASSYQAVITVNATFSTVNIAMYSGTCGALGGGVGGCAVGTPLTATLTVEQMVIGATYYVQISGATGQTGTFNMIIRNNKDCADCINASTFTATPLPVNGMYNPGQVVTFCYHVAQYSQINTNWLHGVQVTLGAGWTAGSIVASPPPPCQGTGTWIWFPTGIGVVNGVNWGPGFYFDTTDPGTIASNNFGDNCSGVQGAGTWNFCFTATVAPGCSPGSNLSVTVNTSGDGESGSWSSIGCVDDPASVLPAVGACCIPTMSSTAATCAGNDGTATATPVGVSGPYNYTWTNSVGAVVSTTSGVAGANTATGLAAGTYTVTVINTALSCQVTNTVTVTGAATITPPTAGSNSPVCVGGTLNLTSTVVAGATYAWTGPNAFTSPLQNTSIAGVTAAASGTYTVVATVGGCTTSATVVVLINPNPTVNVPGPITVCNGANVPLTGFTSTPAGATYTWTNSNALIGLGASGVGSVPAFTASNTTAGAISGTITVTPTLAGCVGTPNTYTITVNPSPTAIVPASFTVCNGANISASGYSSTPVGATFAWTNSNTAIGLAASGTGNTPAFTATNAGTTAIAGTITVTPTLAGCVGTPSNYTITINPTPTVTVPANITVCSGGNVAASAYTSTPGGGTFTWTNSNSSIGLAATGSGNTPAFTATNAGATAVTATITVTPTVAGCPGTPNTYTITVNPTPPAPTALGATICTNNSATLTATAPGGTYTWYDAPIAGTLLITNASYTTPILTVNTTYYVQTTILGCTGPFTPVTVTIAPGLVVNAGLDDTICFAGNTILNVTPNGAGYNYLWSPAAGLSSTTIFNPTANPGTTTLYSVTITDPSGCVGTDDVTIYADPQITIAIAGIDVTCNGACNGQTICIPAGGTPGYTYLWNSGCVAASCSSLCPGTYTVIVTDSWGCTSTNDTAVVQPTLLTSSITGSSNATCNGICDGTATAAGNGGTVGGGYAYSWNTVPAQLTATATGLCAGSYVCTITDANGCTTTTSATITEPTPAVISPIAPVTICMGGSTTLTAICNGGTGPYNFVWSPAGTGSTASVTVSPLVTTVYTVNATDANGCAAAPVNVTVTVNPPLSVVSVGAASICPGASTPISATGSNGTGGPYVYSWSPASGLSNANISNPSASPAVTTVYTVTVTDGCSPPVTSTVTVTVLPLPVVVFSGNILAGCSPLCVTFTDASTVAGSTIASWNWNFGDGSPNDLTQNPPTHCYTNTGTTNATFTVALTVTSTLGGCVSTATYLNYITVYANPIAEFTASPNPANILEPTVNFTDQSTSTSPITSWTWDFSDGTANSNLTNPTHNFPNAFAGTYDVTLTVVDGNGCIDDVTHTIVIDPEFTFFIPNAFTPNGDGVNDFFQGQGIGIAKYEIMIFDRWGNLIWYTDDINKLWDGKANHGDEMAQQDVYVWKVKLTDVFNKKHNYIGTVTFVK